MQSHVPPNVSSCYVCAGVQQMVDNLFVSTLSCDQKCRIPIVILEFDISSSCDEFADSP